MDNKIITPKLDLGKSVRIEVTKSISINIDKPLWQVTRYENPLSLYNLTYNNIRIPVWNLVTLEIYDELN
jgi:hypothetical protein